MLLVDNQNITDPRINLAIEEHLLRSAVAGEDVLLFYINEPSIIIGRNQNTLEEINETYVKANSLHVVRRLSGGGAVYHDLGNLNFSFILRKGRDNFLNFRKFTRPVIGVLNEMGAPAELSGRNDILIEGRKISGNAQYAAGDRMVSHGTLLFESELDRVTQALQVKESKIASKGIKSVRSRVANIREFLPEPIAIESFRQRLLKGIFAGLEPIPQYRLGEADWQAIRGLVNERYGNWEWNYGRSPEFNIQKVERFPFGEIDARIQVQQGRISSIRFFGDYFGKREVAELEQRLASSRFYLEDVEAALQELAIDEYFGGLNAEELARFLV